MNDSNNVGVSLSAEAKQNVRVSRMYNETTGDITHCQVFAGGKVLDAPFTESSDSLCNRVYEETGIELTVSEVMEVCNASRAQMCLEGNRFEKVMAGLPEGAVVTSSKSDTHYWLSSDGELLWTQANTPGNGDPADICPGYIEDVGEIDTEELNSVAAELKVLANDPIYKLVDIEWLRGCEVHIKAFKEEAAQQQTKKAFSLG